MPPDCSDASLKNSSDLELLFDAFGGETTENKVWSSASVLVPPINEQSGKEHNTLNTSIVDLCLTAAPCPSDPNKIELSVADQKGSVAEYAVELGEVAATPEEEQHREVIANLADAVAQELELEQQRAQAPSLQVVSHSRNSSPESEARSLEIESEKPTAEAFAVLPDGRQYVTTSDGRIMMIGEDGERRLAQVPWETFGGPNTPQFACDFQECTTRFSPDGKTLQLIDMFGEVVKIAAVDEIDFDSPIQQEPKEAWVGNFGNERDEKFDEDALEALAERANFNKTPASKNSSDQSSRFAQLPKINRNENSFAPSARSLAEARLGAFVSPVIGGSSAQGTVITGSFGGFESGSATTAIVKKESIAPASSVYGAGSKTAASLSLGSSDSASATGFASLNSATSGALYNSGTRDFFPSADMSFEAQQVAALLSDSNLFADSNSGADLIAGDLESVRLEAVVANLDESLMKEFELEMALSNPEWAEFISDSETRVRVKDLQKLLGDLAAGNLSEEKFPEALMELARKESSREEPTKSPINGQSLLAVVTPDSRSLKLKA